MRKVLIVGATSAIAEATARVLAERGDGLYLVGRNKLQLSAIADDLRTRGCPLAVTDVMDANDFDAHAAMVDRAAATMGGLDTVLIAHGTLSDQAACQSSVELTMAEVKTNALSVIALLTHVANRFEQQKSGTIAVISSVAGDRGRQSNYVYGCSKAMVSAYLSGLRQRLHRSGVAVVTIKPGFVDTPMTRSFKKSPLWVRPEQVARDIAKALDRGADIVYTPFFWRLIMTVISIVPEPIFKRIRL